MAADILVPADYRMAAGILDPVDYRVVFDILDPVDCHMEADTHPFAVPFHMEAQGFAPLDKAYYFLPAVRYSCTLRLLEAVCRIDYKILPYFFSLSFLLMK